METVQLIVANAVRFILVVTVLAVYGKFGAVFMAAPTTDYLSLAVGAGVLLAAGGLLYGVVVHDMFGNRGGASTP